MTLQYIKHFLTSTTARLAGNYLAIIMLMSIGFSAVFYNTTSHQLGRQLPPSSLFDDSPGSLRPRGENRRVFDEFFQNRINEGRQDLLVRLIWLNAGALSIGSAISYYLARRTLRPIEEAMEAQSQFVSDASHELRTPLTALQTTNEVALRKPKLTDATARELIEHNVAEAIRLKTLSDALLGLLKDSDGSVQLEPVQLADIVSDAVNEIVPLAVAKKISVNDDVPNIKILVNKLSIVQVITVLLDNAVKYSPEGKTISINAGIKGHYVYVSVSDHGIGISASDLPHIFRRFYRADKSRTNHEVTGYGLGLAIAERLVRQNHGSISAESTPGNGSTFTVKLPITK